MRVACLLNAHFILNLHNQSRKVLDNSLSGFGISGAKLPQLFLVPSLGKANEYYTESKKKIKTESTIKAARVTNLVPKLFSSTASSRKAEANEAMSYL